MALSVMYASSVTQARILYIILTKEMKLSSFYYLKTNPGGPLAGSVGRT